MAKRRRYDTEALVDQLNTERRTGIVLTFLGGVFVLCFIAALAFFGGEDELPEVDKNDAVAAKADEAAKEAAAKNAAGAEGKADKKDEAKPAEGDSKDGDVKQEAKEEAKEVAEAAPEEPAKPASLKLALTKKGVIWLDGKKIGKFKKKTLELAAGSHTLKAKIGRKIFTYEFEAESGGKMSLVADHRKKKFREK